MEWHLCTKIVFILNLFFNCKGYVQVYVLSEKQYRIFSEEGKGVHF